MAKKGEKMHIYEGYDLYFLLQACGFKGQIELYSRDGLVTALSAEEIMKEGMAILADSIDDTLLPEEDIFRLILSSDNLGRRWAKGVEYIGIGEDMA